MVMEPLYGHGTTLPFKRRGSNFVLQTREVLLITNHY
uniref:Transposase n=1 Tax=Ascaris lumbricoides TaxID=6252 RepID=A0A0M3I3U0_ASCLU